MKYLISIGNFRRLQNPIQVLRVMIQVQRGYGCPAALDLASAKAAGGLVGRLLAG